MENNGAKTDRPLENRGGGTSRESRTTGLTTHNAFVGAVLAFWGSTASTRESTVNLPKSLTGTSFVPMIG